jgi:dCMP deaminase
MNALINCSNKSDLSGAKLFVTLFPCNECAKNLLQAGIVEIIYKDNLYPNNKLFIASKKIFDSVKKIKVRKVKK